MSRRMNYLKVIFLFNAWVVYGSAANCPLDLVIPHGYYNVTTDGNILLFECDKGFILYGTRSAQCFDDGWSHQPPHCITKGCPNVESADEMRVEAKYEGSQLSFRCAAGFELVGNDSIHCNGSHWSAPIPKCVEKRGSLSCDFEKEDLCGWSLDPEGDFPWTWQTGATPTAGTGPNNDHTLGPSGHGHYLFIETSRPTQNGFKAILKSPFYMPDESGQCFSFWYHSHGGGSLSRLEVFVWKEGENEENLRPRFKLDYLKGLEWQNETFYIEPQNEPFKIIFVGTRLQGHKHDIAIDDVSLGPCPENMTIITMAITTTTEMTTELTTKQTSATARETVTKDMTSTSLAQISTSDIPNFSGTIIHWQIPLGRRFRSLKLWLMLRSYGITGVQEYIRRHCRLAKEFEKMILEDGRFEVVTKVVMGLVCFRLKCSNKVTERLLDEILADGRIYLIPAFVRNIYFLRFAICAERTTSDDVKFAFQVIKSCTDRFLQKVSLKNGYKHVPVINIDAPQYLETEENKYSSDSSTPDVDQ